MKERDTLKNKAYNAIKHKIVSCELEPGEPISEKDLMKEICVGRTPVREAFIRLAFENMVRIFPKRGIFVAEITEKEIIDIYTLRECLEPLAVRLATPVLDEAGDIEPQYAIYSSSDYHPAFDEYLRNDRLLHMRLAEASGNEYLAQAIARMYDLNSRIRRYHIANHHEDRMQQTRLEHLELLSCLRRRDAEGAAEAMRKHIDVGMHGVLRSMGIPLAKRAT